MRSKAICATACLLLLVQGRNWGQQATGGRESASGQPAASVLIPAYSYDRGNVRIIQAGSYADVDPVIINAGQVPNYVEYDLALPAAATYTLHIRYAAVSVRPVDVYWDGRRIAQACRSVTGSWQSSSATWERVCRITASAGKHTLKLQCPGPCIPHIVALRLDCSKAFPARWKLRLPTARRLERLPLGQLAGYDNGRDGYEAFVRDDGYVNIPDQYNPIIRFKRHPPPEPAAHRILEYTLMGGGKYRVDAEIVPSVSARADGWAARLTVTASGQRKDRATLPLSERHLRGMLEHTLRLIADFRQTAGGSFLEAERRQAERMRRQVADLVARQPDDAAKWGRFYQLYRQAYRLKNRVALSNPLLRFGKIVFVKRQTYDTSHIYTTYFDGSHRFGGNLYVLGPLRPDAQPRKLVGPLGDKGIYRDPDVSWDGRRVLFSYKPPQASEPYRIYEIGLDGSGLRQLTNSNYDDIDPVYLPDGRILFVSTRARRVVLCHNAFTVSVLHVMEPDGSDIRCVSANTVNEFTPSVAADGSVLYTRWEYVDKNVGNNQSLWRARPDGTFARHVAGAHWGPITFWEPRQVPGSRLIVCTLAPHMPIAVGPIALVDPRDVCRSPARFRNLTPELPPAHHFGWHRNDVGYYCNPYPLSEKYFIVSYSFDPDPEKPNGYGLYVLDRWGNRDLLYRDPAISCFEAMPAVPRRRPAAIADARLLRSATGRPPRRPPSIASAPAAAASATGTQQPEGTLVLLDVYQGLHGVKRGTIKYLRVIEEVPKPVSAQCSGYRLQYPVVSQHGNFAVKRLLGTVPVEPDGSAHFRVPAGRAVYFSALDQDYMAVQRMRSFTTVAAGQTVTCVGCHEDRRAAPPNRPVLALQRPASTIIPPPGGPHAPDFLYDVQPVLNRYCAECHSGQRVEGGVDLSADYTNLFNVAYETLTSGWVSYVNIYSSATLALRPPKYYGSYASKLIEVLRGEHRQYVKLPPEAFRRLVTWIDCNAPYYGTYKYNRPGTVGGRELVSGPVRAALEAVFQRRCVTCHRSDPGRVRRVRVPSIGRSPALLAPLAVAAGGTGRCGKPVFATKQDPDYQAMLTALESLRQQVQAQPRVDMLSRRPPLIDPTAPYRFR